MTSGLPFRIFPLGDSALTIEFGTEISTELNRRAISISDFFLANPFPGFVEAVPAFVSATIYYDLVEVRKRFGAFPTAFEAVSHVVAGSLETLPSHADSSPRRVEIPVDFSPAAALDLHDLAARNGITSTALIEIFTSREYRVYMLGFLPGFTYMGELDERIATPRKETPRTAVPKGSVGIAGTQTGIYSLASPGGWQIIGRTEIEMFDPNGDPPTFLRPGDTVSFVPKT